MIVIYHNKDLDGFASGAICKKRFPEAKLIGYDYGQPIPWDQIPEGEPVIMIDVSLPMSDMYEMAKRSNWQMTWIDHHISAINDYSKFINPSQQGKYNPGFLTSVLEVGRAACEIGWEYLFPNMEMPKAIKLLGKYDTWRNEDKHKWENEILPFQYGMRELCNSAETFPQEMLVTWSNENPFELVRISEVQKQGKTILSYQAQMDATACKKAFEKEFQGLRGLWLNAGYISSNTFASIWNPEKHDIMIGFSYDGEKWTFSLRSDKKEVDCSVIAKTFGGGGHAGAAGFSALDSTSYF